MELADGIDNPALTRWLTRATQKVASHPNHKE
jgi:hypothetical protein